MPQEEFSWHRLVGLDELPQGRVSTVTIGHESLCVTHTLEGGYGCLANACPHQAGPLGEGSIEAGWLRCPWHGYDYSPKNGKPPGAFSDAPAAYRTEVRDDGVYVALPHEMARPRSVSDVMVETMVNWGVTHVFGMVGHSNLGFADAMRAAEERGVLSFIGIRHEGAASFAATAYGKLTGKLAACFAIAGPGSTNLMTGLYDAKTDRAPVLAICGQVPSKVRGRGAFQDTDLSAAFADVARYSQTVQATSDHGELMTLACKTALVERDVAHLVLPDEVQVLAAGDNARVGSPEGRTGDREIAPPAQSLRAAIEAISAADRPLVIIGNGARAGTRDIVAFAEAIDAPVATTFKAKGLISDQHRLAAGVLGRSGTPVASWFMNESDMIVAFGVSFANHTGIADYKPIVQVDFDPMALGRFHPVAVPVQGHVGVVAKALLEGLGGFGDEGGGEPTARSGAADEVAQRWTIWRDEKASRRRDDRGAGIGAAALFDALSDCVPANAVMPVDVGNNTYSFGRYFEVRQQTVLMSGYLGSIGFSLPAAMGCWAATQSQPEYANRPVVSVSGDGGFGQYAMEMTTAVKYGMNITHVLMNNGELGKISKEQRAGDFDVWQTSLHNPDFAAFAELCGAKGIRVTEIDQLSSAIAEAIAHQGPALVEVITDALLV
ncbi:MAG: Rieske 2Fe-2S domain-containing protein [Acidimicrobiaceae bacterium]|nr:Rieske 2Fe-2S domain-containing protein [Acidimicrobiaceae bacterium]MXW76093.1 Rieske 2Fe-2S domain-containing protein [Acidimicrobiaceae bacterium]MYC40962.1 Rieske 2Fe-2S domain-containing protein [Acidimicrobiaceae bacterium]MYD07420.1 Rieske 2Fe-2S domain-containing protein [Acidimicrobiaceae bacterium]MYH87514.1 Rieske 2Fe-2S domain-containing protein [Acidimicrobiaceae bacterium]